MFNTIELKKLHKKNIVAQFTVQQNRMVLIVDRKNGYTHGYSL